MKCTSPRIIYSVLVVFATVWTACDQGINTHGPVEREEAITAAFKAVEVNSLASSYGKGLRLFTVRSSAVNSDGTSAMWLYEYLDSGGSVYCFHSTYHSVEFDSVSRVRTGIMIFTHSWFNSDVAMNIAEKNGGSDFRGRNPGCAILASLAQPLVPESSTYWYVTYRSTSNQARLDLTIDAVSGSVSYPIIDRLTNANTACLPRSPSSGPRFAGRFRP